MPNNRLDKALFDEQNQLLNEYDQYRSFYLHPTGEQGIADVQERVCRPKLLYGTTAAQLISGAKAALTGVLFVQGANQATITFYDCSSILNIDNSNRKMVLGTPGTSGVLDGVTFNSPVLFEEGLVVVVSQADTYVTILSY